MIEWSINTPTKDGWYWAYGWAGAGRGWRYRNGSEWLQMVRVKAGKAHIGKHKVKEDVAYWLGPLQNPVPPYGKWCEKSGNIILKELGD